MPHRGCVTRANTRCRSQPRRTRATGGRWILRCSDAVRAAAAAGPAATVAGDGLIHIVAEDDRAANAVLAAVVQAGVTVREFRADAADLTRLTLDLLKEQP